MQKQTDTDQIHVLSNPSWKTDKVYIYIPISTETAKVIAVGGLQRRSQPSERRQQGSGPKRDGGPEKDASGQGSPTTRKHGEYE